MGELRDVRADQSLCAYDLRKVTEAAARAAYAWIGRGDKSQSDAAAITAMTAELEALGLDGQILIGEGPRSETSQLFHGQRFGDPGRLPNWDIAVDPVEGTSFLAKGMTNAMACIAVAPHGSLFDPGPAFYMEKFAAPPAAKGKIDPAAPVEEKLRVLSVCLDKAVEDLTVYVLEKPRHRELVARIHDTGARVALYPAGDVAGALMAAIPGSGIDALMGSGGAPEGMLSAVAIRVMGGEYMARIDPQLATERRAVVEAGMDMERWWSLEELVRSDAAMFCATGITTGLLFEGIERAAGFEKTQTLMVGGGAGPRQLLTTWHPRAA
ncbi:MAG TPA: class II fructose-bisphosphatase [Candidatus Omnitrophota bacterium]|nr:class II fructose-bisphosphatase [Candidatus Omnitrophota bacterium]